jgi:O-antigen ligase
MALLTNKGSQRPSNRVSALILFAALAGAPFLFGSRDPTTIAFWCFLLGVGLVFASMRRLQRGHFLLLAGLAVIVAGYAFVLHEQLSEHPWIATPNPIWAKASDLLGRPLTPSVSIVRDEPFFALGAPLAAALSLTLGLVVGAERRRARQALSVTAWAGAVYAVYGIFALLFTHGKMLGREKTAYIGDLTATFINRNTAAAYFGSCAVLWLFLLMEAVRGHLPKGPIVWRKVLPEIFSETPKSIAIRLSMLLLCLAAMFLTSSRGGVLVSLLALVVAFLAYFGRDLPHGKGVAAALLGAGFVAMLLLQFMGSNVGGRISEQGLSDSGRLAAYRITLRIIADNPWFGTGLGTFAWAFPPYRSGDISMVGVWDMAHSTPLQLASELGIPLALLVAFGWIVALVVLIRASRGRRRDAIMPLAALMVSFIALVHSSIDFSLQVPGYAIVALGILGVGLGQSFHEPKAAMPSHHGRAREPAEAISA